MLYSIHGECLDFRLVQAGIRVLVLEGGRGVERLLPEAEVRGRVEVVAGERGVLVDFGQVEANVELRLEVVADGGAGPVPRAPEEGLVERLELLLN